MRLILYTTDHCTLCEQALDLLLAMPEVAGHTLLVMDIANDDVLLNRYADRIPVLVCGQHELSAPIDHEQVRQLLEVAGADGPHNL